MFLSPLRKTSTDLQKRLHLLTLVYLLVKPHILLWQLDRSQVVVLYMSMFIIVQRTIRHNYDSVVI